MVGSKVVVGVGVGVGVVVVVVVVAVAVGTWTQRSRGIVQPCRADTPGGENVSNDDVRKCALVHAQTREGTHRFGDAGAAVDCDQAGERGGNLEELMSVGWPKGPFHVSIPVLHVPALAFWFPSWCKNSRPSPHDSPVTHPLIGRA